MDNSLIFNETEGCEFAPAIIEARVIGVVFSSFWEEIFDPLLGNSARFQSGVPIRRESIGVESDEGVFGIVFFQGVIEGEEAGEVGGVGYKRRPDCAFGRQLNMIFDKASQTILAYPSSTR